MLRKSPGIYPVDVVVRSAHDSAVTRADGSVIPRLGTFAVDHRTPLLHAIPKIRVHDAKVRPFLQVPLIAWERSNDAPLRPRRD